MSLNKPLVCLCCRQGCRAVLRHLRDIEGQALFLVVRRCLVSFMSWRRLWGVLCLLALGPWNPRPVPAPGKGVEREWWELAGTGGLDGRSLCPVSLGSVIPAWGEWSPHVPGETCVREVIPMLGWGWRGWTCVPCVWETWMRGSLSVGGVWWGDPWASLSGGTRGG